jgi:hypothetical protein
MSPTKTRWSVEETILVADYVWTHKARPTGADLTALREEVVAVGSSRSEDAVSMQAFEFADEWGYATWTGREGTVQIAAIAKLFEACHHDMHRLARTIALLGKLHQIRAE